MRGSPEAEAHEREFSRRLDAPIQAVDRRGRRSIYSFHERPRPASIPGGPWEKRLPDGRLCPGPRGRGGRAGRRPASGHPGPSRGKSRLLQRLRPVGGGPGPGRSPGRPRRSPGNHGRLCQRIPESPADGRAGGRRIRIEGSDIRRRRRGGAGGKAPDPPCRRHGPRDRPFQHAAGIDAAPRPPVRGNHRRR